MKAYHSTKYRNKKIAVDGIVFDSKKEADRYVKLSLMEKAGIISNLRLQVKYELIPTQREVSTEVYTKGSHKGEYKPGKVIEKSCNYIADFDYYMDGVHVVEDVKGYRKGGAYALFKIKKKLMLYVHKIRVVEV